MASLEISRKKKWEIVHNRLDHALKDEIHTMREILASLHQEELALLEGNFAEFRKVMQKRSHLIILLAKERNSRMEATIELTKSAVLSGEPEMLPHSEASSCSILTKLDQLVALSERTNLQNCRNEALFSQKREKKSQPLKCSYPHPLHRVRKKTRVATYGQS